MQLGSIKISARARKIFLRSSITFACATILLLMSLFVLFSYYGKDLPNYEQLKVYNPAITTRIYSSDGVVLKEYAKEHRIFTPLKKIPTIVSLAFIAAEDEGFYKNSGISFISIARAGMQNLFALITNRKMVGASTITQQVVKNMLLTNERTISRKIKEIILARRITTALGKEQILELYLNQIYLGHGAYGVQAAALTYFSKTLDQLAIEEVALLAAMPKAPTSLDPSRRADAAKARRDWVIGRMLSTGLISSSEAATATSTALNLKLGKIDNDAIKAGAFADSVKKELISLYGSDEIWSDGKFVRTTLDSKLQQMAEHALREGIESYDMRHGWHGKLGSIVIDDDKNHIEFAARTRDKLSTISLPKLSQRPEEYNPSWRKAVVLAVNNKEASIWVDEEDMAGAFGTITAIEARWTGKSLAKLLTKGDVVLVKSEAGKYMLRQVPDVNGGMVVLDPKTGRILAMVGGYLDDDNRFNRATQALRQPGSVMKPFTYIAALENGLTPADIVVDAEISLDQGGNLGDWSPKNSTGDFRGPTTLRNALEQSRNAATVRIAQIIGLEKVADVMRRTGALSDPPLLYSLSLGSIETRLLQVATAYGIIANGGKKISPRMIDYVSDRSGKVIYQGGNIICSLCNFTALMPVLTASSSQEILASDTNYQIISMLQGVVQRGTAAKAAFLSPWIAGKTGTTNDSVDGWFIGFTTDLVVATYIGYDRPRSLGRNESGASVALPVFTDFMTNALKLYPAKPFPIPETIKLVKINRKTGEFTNGTIGGDVIYESFKLNDTIADADSINNKETTEDRSLIHQEINSGVY